MNQDRRQRQQFKYVQPGALILGVVALGVAIAGAFLDLEHFFRAYLVAFLYWMGIALGCLALLMLHHLVNGTWGFAVQRLFAAGARTLPLMAVLFLPLIFGITYLYPWSVQDAAAGEELLLQKSLYLNVPFFLIRAAIYFIVWIGLAFTITRWSYCNDVVGEEALLWRTQRLSAFGLIFFVVTASLAAIDWSMSLEPNWFSSVYGWLFIAREALGALALAIAILGLLWRRPPLSGIVTPRLLNDLGNLLLALLLTWAYLAFIQYLVIWYGNIPEEVVWYAKRTVAGWQWVALSLVVLHLAMPAVLLLFRENKRRMVILSAIAGLIVLMRLADIFWVVMPSFLLILSFHWLDIVLPVALGGLWITMFLWQLKQHSLLPLNHPKLLEVMEQQRRERYEIARDPS